MEKITSSAPDLMEHAVKTANDYMADAILMINKQLGNGYAQQHPELIGAFMQTAAQDFKTSTLCSVIQDLEQAIRDLIDSKNTD